MDKIITRIGSVSAELDVFNLKDVLVKNDAGDWGDEPKEDAIGIIRSTNFTNEGMLDLKDVAYRSLKPNKRLEKKLFENEILIERSGGSETQPVGRVGLVTNEIGSSDFAFANFIQRIALNETVEPNYVYYCLQQMYEMGITRAMQYQTTGIRNLDWKLYTKSVLPKPPKPEQTAIATILSKVDEAIEATQNSIKAAEKLKKALMQNLLTGKLKPDGSWRTHDEFYVDEKFGKVPKGWILGKVKKVIKLKNGKGNTTSNLKNEPDTEYNIPVFGGNGITGYYHTPLLTEPTLIIGRVGEYCGNVFLTPTQSWVTDNAMLVDKFLIEDYSLEFFKYKFNTLNFIYYSDTTGQPKLTQGSIGSILFIYPESKIEQTEIADKINSVELNITEKQIKIRTLQRLKKSLMQNLLTGKVRLDVEKVNKILSEQTL